MSPTTGVLCRTIQSSDDDKPALAGIASFNFEFEFDVDLEFADTGPGTGEVVVDSLV